MKTEAVSEKIDLATMMDSPVGRSESVIKCTRISSVLGDLIAATTDAGICLLEFEADGLHLPASIRIERQLTHLRRRFQLPLRPGRHPHLSLLRQELKAYFTGRLRNFTVPLDIRGTDFQCALWHALRGITYGQTANYSALAALAGRPSAVRAAGAANGANPLAILVPCHRVVGSSGALTGYGGGIARKAWLLALESGTRTRFDEQASGEKSLQTLAKPD